MNKKRIFRYEVPGKYDHLPFGTEIVRLSNILYGPAELYRQLSHDPENPQWISLGVLEDGLLCQGSEDQGSTASVSSCEELDTYPGNM